MIKRLLGVMVIALLLFGVATYLKGVIGKYWTEEVQLDDGRIIQVRRHVVYEATDALGGGAYNAVEKASTLKFTGTLKDLPMWSAPLVALVLYQDATTGEWVIVATTTSNDVWRVRGRPNPPYWEYRVHPRGWEEVPLSHGSIGRRRNLFMGYDHPFPWGQLTLAEKRQLERDIKTLQQMTPIERSYRIIIGPITEPGWK